MTRDSGDYYAILGLSSSAGKDEIVKAYRTLVARYHPDKHQDNDLRDLAEEKLSELNEAYNVLSDPKRRAAYDRNRKPFTEAVDSSPTMGSSPFPVAKIISLLGLVALGIFGLRFLRSPRINALLGLLVLVFWFGPRLYRRFRKTR